jgi:hypothetical protein
MRQRHWRGGGLLATPPSLATPSTPWYAYPGLSDLSDIAAAYQPQGAADLASSYRNIVWPGLSDVTVEWGVPPTWNVATGWGLNGTTHLLNTHITPNPDQTWSMFVRYSGIASNATSHYLCGVLQVPGSFSCRFYLMAMKSNNTNNQFANGDINNYRDAAAHTSGVIGFAGRECYYNGINVGTLPVGPGTTNLTILIGGVSGTYELGSSEIGLMIVCKKVLTPAQSLALSTAMAAE